MIRKLLTLVLAVAVIVSMVVGGCVKPSSTPTPQKPVELSFAHEMPAMHPINTKVFQPWIDEIEKATNGKVKIINYPGQTLLKSGEVYDGVVDGLADIGYDAVTHNAGRFPVAELFMLPGVQFNNASAATAVVWDSYNELKPLQEEFSQTHVLFMFDGGPCCLMTQSPVRTLEDLKGMPIRATSTNVKTIEALGASPVPMPMPDSYEALHKGVVKGDLSMPDVLETWKHAEVINYVTWTPYLFNVCFYTVMNLDKWNSLTDDEKNVFTTASENLIVKYGPLVSGWQKEGLEFALDKGVKVIYLPEDEKARWIERVKPIQEGAMKHLDELGLGNEGRQTLDTIFQLCEKYNKIYPSMKEELGQ